MKCRIDLPLRSHRDCLLRLASLFNLNVLENWNNYQVEGNGTPLQYSCLVNPMDRGAW